MTLEDAMAAVQRLLASTDVLAAVGTDLAAHASGADVDPAVGAAVASVVKAAGIDLDAIPAPQQAMLLGMIRLSLRMADDFVTEPGRRPGWTTTDPLVLESIGRSSMAIPPMLAATPELSAVRSLLDVGVGVGWLAVAAAGVWPEAHIVGIDVWEPALNHTRHNVRDAGLDDRIDIRNQDVTTLAERDAYDCVWVPTFFLSESALATGLANIVRTTRAGGWVVLGRLDSPPDPVARASVDARTVRTGGAVVDEARARELLIDVGCVDVRPLERSGPIPVGFVIGRIPS